MIRLLLIVFIISRFSDAMPTSGIHVLPKAYESNKIKAVLDENFFLTCISPLGTDSPSGLRWITPNGQPAQDDPSHRIYTILNNNQLALHLEKIVPTDSGVYTCQGVREGLVDEVKIELTLEKKISFYETNHEQFIRAGQDQLVSCRASSIPGPEITWFKKGVSINLKNDENYQITNDGLIIKNVKIEDEGVYICQASVTSTGEIKRSEIDVQVMHEPIWDLKPTDTDGVNGQDIVIKCKAHAKPEPKYNWYRNGIQLAGDRYTFTSESLRIIKSNTQDRGTYTCEAENNSGKIQSNFRINVLVGPVINPIEEVTVIEGDEAVVKCIVSESFPKSKITWKYSDSLEVITPLSDKTVEIVDDSDPNLSELEGDLIGSWSELRIKPAGRNFNRNLTCVASNKAEVVERNVRLHVDYKPTLLLNSEAREYYYSWLNTDLSGSSGSVSSLSTRGAGVRMTCIASGEPRPQITWFFKTEQIKHDNVKYILHRDELGLSQIEIVPQGVEDFGSYQCKAENRVGANYRNIELRVATSPKLPPFVLLKSSKPESVGFEVKLSDAADSNGGLPVDSLKVQWRFLASDWSNQYEKNFPIDKSNQIDINNLLPDTEYLFRVASGNRVGLGVWSKEIKIKTLSRRQPDPIRVLSKEDCQASTRCYVEWTVDSNGGSPVREYTIRWRRISYKDSSNQHINHDRIEQWSSLHVIKAPLSNYEITSIQANSFYEVEVIAKNDIGPSPTQPFRIRTLPGQIGESEAFKKSNESVINKVILITGSVIAAVILFIIIDVMLLMKSNCGLLALLTKSCGKHKEIPIDYKPTPTKIAQHEPKSNTPYQPISQEEANVDVSIPLNE